MTGWWTHSCAPFDGFPSTPITAPPDPMSDCSVSAHTTGRHHTREIIYMERMQLDRKLEASRQGSK